MRTALVSRNGTTPEQVARYLPSNYKVTATDDSTITVSGKDAGVWTLDGYVIPRLASGLIFAWEVIRSDNERASPPVLPLSS